MKIFRLIPLLLLTACATASPTASMSEKQVSQLSDTQLCNLQEKHRFEPKLEVEIGKRDLECTPEYLACKKQGYDPKTPVFEQCKDYQSMRNMAGNVLDYYLAPIR